MWPTVSDQVVVCQSVCRSVTLVSPAKPAETIEMPFGLWARMDPRNHVLDGGPQVLRDVSTATNFWLLMGSSSGCVIASDTLFDSRGGFSGVKLSDEKSPDRMFKGHCHGNRFWD